MRKLRRTHRSVGHPQTPGEVMVNGSHLALTVPDCHFWGGAWWHDGKGIRENHNDIYRREEKMRKE